MKQGDGLSQDERRKRYDQERVENQRRHIKQAKELLREEGYIVFGPVEQ